MEQEVKGLLDRFQNPFTGATTKDNPKTTLSFSFSFFKKKNLQFNRKKYKEELGEQQSKKGSCAAARTLVCVCRGVGGHLPAPKARTRANPLLAAAAGKLLLLLGP